MKFKMLRCIAAVGMMLTGLSASAYEQGDTILVGSDTDSTVFLEVEWYDADSVSNAGASSVGSTLTEGAVTAYLMNNNAVLSYTIDVKGDGGVYDVVYAYRCVRYDRTGYLYMDLDKVRHGQLDAKQNTAYEGHPAWHSSFQSTSTDPLRKYVSLTLTPGIHNLQFKASGGSGNFYCDYIALVPRTVKTTDVACTSYVDTVKIEAEFFDQAQSDVTAGKTTMCVRNYSTCVGNNTNGNTLVFPLNVLGDGGKFKLEYVYAKMISSQSAWFRPYLDDAVDYWGHYALNDTAANGQWISIVSGAVQTLTPGAHKITVKMGYSESHFIDYIRLIPIELTGDFTGVKSPKTTSLTLSPNPVINALKFSGNDIVSAQVYDFAGRQLMSQEVLGNTLDVSELVHGTYLIRMTDEAGVQAVQRFIKK